MHSTHTLIAATSPKKFTYSARDSAKSKKRGREYLLMLCPIRARLTDELSTSVSEYFKATSELSAIVEQDGHAAHVSEHYAKAKQEKQKCDHTRKALEDHIAEHHCGSGE